MVKQEKENAVEKPKEAKARKAFHENPLFWMSVGSIAWLTIAYFMLINTKPCECSSHLSWYNLIERYLSCRSSNELGDFLAGVFAPLAFIWVAGTVFIQSRELAAQQQELAVTRKVLEEQTEEAKASRQFIGEQTQLLKKDRLEAERRLADQELEALVLGLPAILSNAGNIHFLQDLSGIGKKSHKRDLVIFEEADDPKQCLEKLEKLPSLWKKLRSDFDSMSDINRDLVCDFDAHENSLNLISKQIKSLKRRVSKAGKLRMMGLKLEKSIDCYSNVLKQLKKQYKK